MEEAEYIPIQKVCDCHKPDSQVESPCWWCTENDDNCKQCAFIVNTLHIGKDGIRLLAEDGSQIYFPMTERCKQDQKRQAEAIAAFYSDAPNPINPKEEKD